MTRKRYFSLIIILGGLTALGPFSIDMYLPGFPAIARSFHTSISQVSLSLSSFFIGISAGQLLYGPLLDRFGRKKPLYFGLSLYILASVGCFTASSIDMLIALRFVQAVGSCAAGVAAMAMVRDIFPLEDNAKVFALLILVLGASPMIAPTVGGYVTAAYGWHLIFIILGSIAVLIFCAVIFALPESYQPDPSFSLKPRPIVLNFLSVLKNPQFYTYCFCGAVAFSGLFAYISASPLVFMEVFKVSSKEYGWIFAFLSVGFIGSSQLNNVLLKKFNSGRIVNVTLIGMVAVAFIFLAGAYYGWFGLYSTIGMIFLILCCTGIINPNTSALSLAPFEKNAGTASALLGAFQMCIGALASLGVGVINGRSAVPMAGIMAVTALLALLILLVGKRNIKQKVTVKEGPVIMSH